MILLRHWRLGSDVFAFLAGTKFSFQKSLFKIIGDLKARPWRMKPLDLALLCLKWHRIHSIVLA